jgi:hypothetical protein
LARASSGAGTRCAIQADRAKANATLNTPAASAAATSTAMLSAPPQAKTANNANNTARTPSHTRIARRLGKRSIQGPSHKAPTAPATMSATTSIAICASVAASAKLAIHGIAKRVSMLPKLETPSAAIRRRISGVRIAALCRRAALRLDHTAAHGVRQTKGYAAFPMQ